MASLEGFGGGTVAGVGTSSLVLASGSTTARTLGARAADVINVLDQGIVGDGVTDNTAALAALMTYVLTLPNAPKVVFPKGTYCYSVSPNWAMTDLWVVADGQVIFNYTGTGDAVIIDGGPDLSDPDIFNMKFGPFIVYAPGTAGDGVLVRGIHHSEFHLNVRGAGTSSAGVHIQFAVCTIFYITVSINEAAIDQPPPGGWESGQPMYGIFIDQRGEYGSQPVAYSTFINPVIEGVSAIGIYNYVSLGNTYIGGTCEDCPVYGFWCSNDTNNDKIIAMDLEANGDADISCGGTNIVFIDCDTDYIAELSIDSKACQILGGSHQLIVVDPGATGNTIKRVLTNRQNLTSGYTSTGFLDYGTGTFIGDFRTANALVEFPAYRKTEVVEEFIGNTLNTNLWLTLIGTDPGCIAATVQSVNSGAATMTTGAGYPGSMAQNGTQLSLGSLQWAPANGGFAIEVKVRMNIIAYGIIFIGLTNQTADLQMPFTLIGSTLANVPSDACGLLYDSRASPVDTNIQWEGVGVAGGVLATPLNVGFYPIGNTWETYRLCVDFEGNLTIFRNGVLIGVVENAITPGNTYLGEVYTPTQTYVPVVAAFSNTSGSVAYDIDYIIITQDRA